MISKIVFIAFAMLCMSFAAASQLALRNIHIDPSLESDIAILKETPEPSSGHINVVSEVPIVLSARQLREEVTYAVNETSSGFARVSSVGLTVQRGTRGTLRYRIRVKAIEASRLANSDSSFESTLSQSERETYRERKSSYRGGLGVPFLRFIGIRLGASTSSVDMNRSFDSQTNYNQKASAASQIINNIQEENLEISGMLEAEGTSFIPTTVQAFIKIARIQLTDGSTKTVVTTDPGELVAATPTGSTVPSDSGTIEILPF